MLSLMSIIIITIAYGGYHSNVNTDLEKDNTFIKGLLDKRDKEISNLHDKHTKEWMKHSSCDNELRSIKYKEEVLDDNIRILKREREHFEHYQYVWKACERVKMNTLHKVYMNTDVNYPKCCIKVGSEERCFDVNSIDHLLTLIQLIPNPKGVNNGKIQQ